MKQHEVKDLDLAPLGHQKINWVKNNMPLLLTKMSLYECSGKLYAKGLAPCEKKGA